MDEIWKDIEGFEGKYQVSTKGNVRSLRYLNSNNIKLLKAKINKYGYREYTLSKGNKRYFFLAMKLVAQAFIPNPYHKPKTTHISNNKQDDSVENIKWVYDCESKLLMYKKGNRKIGKYSGNKITYKGKGYKNYSILATKYKMTLRRLLTRLSSGWELSDALETPVTKSNFKRNVAKYEYYDEELTITQIATKIGITPRQMLQRLEKRMGYL